MKCVILGPTDFNKIKRHGSIVSVKNYVKEAAVFFDRNFDELILIPDFGLPFMVAKEFKKINKNNKIIGIIPDKTTGGKNLSKYFENFDEIRGIGGGWFNLNTQLTKLSDIVFCLGYSAGVFIELSSIKYDQKYLNLKTEIYIDKKCVSSELFPELEEDLENINYFENFEDLIIHSKKSEVSI